MTTELKTKIVWANVAGGGDPVWGGEVTRWAVTASGYTREITLPSGIAAGNTVVIIFMTGATSGQVASVADDRGNTYTIDKTAVGNVRMDIISAYVSTALQSGDHVTVTCTTDSFRHQWGSLHYLQNVASSSPVDQTASAVSQYSTAVSISGVTSVATTLIGIINAYDGYTYEAFAWTVSGLAHAKLGKSYYVYENASSSGTQDPSGNWDEGNEGWDGVWVAYKG